MTTVSRRTLLAAAGLSGSLLAGSGCLSSLTGPPPAGISASDVTVQRGETGFLAVDVEHVRMVGFRHEWASASGFVTYAADRVTPVPDEGMDSYPPYWVWDDVEAHVDFRIQVAPTADVTPGTYRLVVRIWQSRQLDAEPAASAAATIEVT